MNTLAEPVAARAAAAALPSQARAQLTSALPLLRVHQLGHHYGDRPVLYEAALDLWPGEVLAVVGESGSGKTTLLNAIAARIRPTRGTVSFLGREGVLHDVHQLSLAQQRLLARTDWGFVHQNPADGLRMDVSAGANVAERLMGLGERHYGRLRETAQAWLERVEIDPARIDDTPRTFSGGMRQRLQIARNLVTQPRLLFMDEPTSGLDVSVQARLLDLLRHLCSHLHLAVVIVTHDLAVARLLAHRMVVMQRGRLVETGLTDQVLDDPQHPYTQLLVSSVLQA
jgi:putative phosphonate transport system ATP-binding protein